MIQSYKEFPFGRVETRWKRHQTAGVTLKLPVCRCCFPNPSLNNSAHWLKCAAPSSWNGQATKMLLLCEDHLFIVFLGGKKLSDCTYISYCFSLSFSFLSSFPSFFSPFILQALMPLWYDVADMVRDGEVGIWGIWWVAEKGRKDFFFNDIRDIKKMTKFWFYSFHNTAFNQGDRYKAKQAKKQKNL